MKIIILVQCMFHKMDAYMTCDLAQHAYKTQKLTVMHPPPTCQPTVSASTSSTLQSLDESQANVSTYVALVEVTEDNTYMYTQLWL